MQDTLHIRETTARDPLLRMLISRLDEELFERYPEDAVYTLDLDDPVMDGVTFIIAEAGGDCAVSQVRLCADRPVWRIY